MIRRIWIHGSILSGHRAHAPALAENATNRESEPWNCPGPPDRGGTDRSASPDDGELTLGVPIYFEGCFEGDSHSRSSYVAFRLGDTPCVLTLLLAAGSRRAAA